MSAPTRRVIAHCAISLDGYSSGPDGPAHDTWLHRHATTESSAQHYEGLWRGCSSAVVGRGNYVGFSAVWPGMTAHPAAVERTRALGRWLAEVEKAVVTTTLSDADLATAARTGPANVGAPETAVPWTNARAFPDPAAAVTALRVEPGRGILVLNSASVIQELLRHDLVDDLALTTVPVLLGGGLRLLDGGAGGGSAWSLVTATTMPHGAVATHHRRVR